MLDVESVTELVDRLKMEIFPDITIGMLHGKMPSSEKEEVMAKFSAGKTSILVSTSVVEVGVDVPNATVMCIEGAERFGLAQLHQFRGRVGRGAHASQCYLFPSTGNPVAIDRLKAMEVIDDGFALAEKDLRIRGPGDILGEAQSGFLPTLMMASAEDLDLLKDARTAAERILDADPALEAHPALRSMLDKAFNAAHLE
jgi:ATP-dependent DNA helicase RecG